MTTVSSSPVLRERGLGRGVSTLIPLPEAPSPTGQAAAALAALATVPVRVGVLQAAAVLLEDLARTTADEPTRETAAATARLLRDAMDPAGH